MFIADQQIPWLGAGIGIILGVIVVIADYLFTNKPTLTVSNYRNFFFDWSFKNSNTIKLI